MKFKAQGKQMSCFLCVFFALSLGIVSNSHAEKWDEAISDASFAWQDEAARDFRLSSLSNANVVVTMIYTSCRKTCPELTLRKLKLIQEKVNTDKIPTQFVLVTFDPEEDTVQELIRFKNKLIREKIAINAENWHLLRGSKEDTRKFATLIGLGNYWKMDDHVQHGFRILYFDRKNSQVRVLDQNKREVESLFQ